MEDPTIEWQKFNKQRYSYLESQGWIKISDFTDRGFYVNTPIYQKDGYTAYFDGCFGYLNKIEIDNKVFDFNSLEDLINIENKLKEQ